MVKVRTQQLVRRADHNELPRPGPSSRLNWENAATAGVPARVLAAFVLFGSPD